MAEHRSASGQQLPGDVQILCCVILDEIPVVYALHHPEDGVTAWVLGLPSGDAIILPLDDDGEADGTGMIRTTLDQAATRWAALDHADLVLVTT